MNLSNYRESQRPRPILVGALVFLGLYLAATVIINLWQWRAFRDFPYTPPIIENAVPAFPDPHVLHRTRLVLPNAAVGVPYQAGAYEISEVLPAELTVFYHHNSSPKEARVVWFTRPQWERRRLLADGRGKLLLDGGKELSDMLTILQAGPQPSFPVRLAPWMVLEWAAARDLQPLLRQEGGGGEAAGYWTLHQGQREIIGREYRLPRSGGRRLALTVFQEGRAIDLHFSFSNEDPDNLALVRAWLEGINPFATDETDMQHCEKWTQVKRDDPALWLCRKLVTNAHWLNHPGDQEAAASLLACYWEAEDRRGLQVLHEQLALLKDEDAQTRQFLANVETALDELSQDHEAVIEEQETPPAETEVN